MGYNRSWCSRGFIDKGVGGFVEVIFSFVSLFLSFFKFRSRSEFRVFSLFIFVFLFSSFLFIGNIE